ATAEEMRREVAAWQTARNNRSAPINWHFTAADARIKLTRTYPKL
ncbi:MAG: IS630 family transposase, partial [Puniceicoccales bacterium]|nr:IS630 family transposase [Puniceicoccales bacterium]